MNIALQKYLGWAGTTFGIAGAALLSLNIAISPIGYLLFLVSSILLSLWAYRDRHTHQLVMQMVFTAINLNGVINWLVL